MNKKEYCPECLGCGTHKCVDCEQTIECSTCDGKRVD